MACWCVGVAPRWALPCRLLCLLEVPAATLPIPLSRQHRAAPLAARSTSLLAGLPLAGVQRAAVPPLLARCADALHEVHACAACLPACVLTAGPACLLGHAMPCHGCNATQRLLAPQQPGLLCRWPSGTLQTSPTPPHPNPQHTRYGTVEIAPREDLKSWALGRRLSLPARRMLLWAHLLALNGVCIGGWRRDAGQSGRVHSVRCWRDVRCWNSAHCAAPCAAGRHAVRCSRLHLRRALRHAHPRPPRHAPCLRAALCVYYTVTTNDTPDTANRADMEELGHSSLATLWFAIAWVVVTLSLQVLGQGPCLTRGSPVGPLPAGVGLQATLSKPHSGRLGRHQVVCCIA